MNKIVLLLGVFAIGLFLNDKAQGQYGGKQLYQCTQCGAISAKRDSMSSCPARGGVAGLGSNLTHQWAPLN